MSDNSGFNSFSTNKGNSGIKDFFESNSLVAKFAFLLLVVIAFVFLLKIGINLINWMLSPNESPHLINGMVDATIQQVFYQDPSATQNYVPIYRSINTTDGIEFTWSVWIFVSDLQYMQGKFKNVFYKGNYNIESDGLNFPNNAPGLYIAPDTNELVVIMNTFNVINEEVTISDIPLNKWLNVIIRCQGTILDVFINGTMTKHTLFSVMDALEEIHNSVSNYANEDICLNYSLKIKDRFDKYDYSKFKDSQNIYKYLPIKLKNEDLKR